VKVAGAIPAALSVPNIRDFAASLCELAHKTSLFFAANED
jgi:hypothetical protein